MNTTGRNKLTVPSPQQATITTSSTEETVALGRRIGEQLQPGDCFELETGRRFIRGARLRSRYRCIETETGVEYRVHGLARVVLAPD